MHSEPNRFLYQGKELQEGTQLYDLHDPWLGRWHQVDPKASKREGPYVGFGNNPVLYSDPLGDTTILMGWNNYVQQFNNNFHSGVQQRVQDPSILIDDAVQAADGAMQFIGDVTGLKSLMGKENQTANAVEAVAEKVMDVPNMSEEEVGALLAAGAIMGIQMALEKKVPNVSRLNVAGQALDI